MKPMSRVLIGVILLVILAAAPSIEGKITGKHNQAAAGCTCHYNGGGITATHDFPSTYTAGQTYTVNIGFTGGTSASVGGFSLQVDKGTLSNAGSLVQINGLSATHSSSGSVSWTLDWIAPTSGSGTMSMDLAVLQGNGNSATSGDVWSQASASIAELVPNTPPTVSSLSLSPNGDVGVNQSLTLSYTYADANGDPESGTQIRWFSDGVLATGFNDQLSLPDSATSVGENWTVTVTPNDGIDLGTTESCPDYANIIDIDTDGDGTFNLVDTDDDDDGVLDTADAFPLDATESLDTDGDGTGNNADTDDDDDGVADASDDLPLDATESVDTDGDGTGNNADTDDDDDSVLDTADAFPLDATESVDTDGDGTGNNADTDDDDDSVLDTADAFPLDATESVDTDGDGTGNNADTDDDDDSVLDTADAFPLDATESVDTDGDGTGNNADTDDDDDGVADASDDLPLDATESVDTDGDGIGNTADSDDDGDNVTDVDDAFPLDATESIDTDGDGTGNNADTDDDGDGVIDTADAFPLDSEKIVDEQLGTADEGDSQQLMIIVAVSLLIAGVVAGIVIMRRMDDGIIEPEQDFNQNFMAGRFKPTDTAILQQISQPIVTPPVAVQSVAVEPAVVQQWTDEGGNTWRKMDNGTTLWWNGTDWQQS